MSVVGEGAAGPETRGRSVWCGGSEAGVLMRRARAPTLLADDAEVSEWAKLVLGVENGDGEAKALEMCE